MPFGIAVWPWVHFVVKPIDSYVNPASCAYLRKFCVSACVVIVIENWSLWEVMDDGYLLMPFQH
jgi:hypothetical protein